MKLMELLYFLLTALVATLVARWAYGYEEWVGGAFAFAVVLCLSLWFFFTGRLYRLVSFILRRPDLRK